MKLSAGRRSWVKLWVNDWLDGTSRWQLTGAQRAFWVDLLAMAGRGRIGGIVCSGRDGDTLIGYPLKTFEALSLEQIDIVETFALFERTGKITLEVRGDSPKLYVVHITGWDRYQSEYERNKKYREHSSGRGAKKVHAKSRAMSQKSSTTETEAETEAEPKADSETEKRDDVDASLPSSKNTKTEIPRPLRSWMRTQILKRNDRVENPRAYVRASMPEFLKRLPDEVEDYLFEKIVPFVTERLDAKSTLTKRIIRDFLGAEARKHELPIDADMIARVVTSANEFLDLKGGEPLG